MSYIGLESVSSIVTTDGIIFPTDVSDTEGVHIYDTDNEWWENMSLEDAGNLFRFLADNTALYHTEGYMSWAVRMYEVVERAHGIYECAYEDSWHYSNSL